jgi:NDP-sugar pyrophosphorylase family protein
MGVARPAGGLGALSAVVLCGGLGTRLRSAVDGQKTMAPIGEKPFLEILLEWAAGHGVKRFVLCTGYKSEQVEKYFRSSRNKVEVVISPETSPLGTGGAVRNALPLLKGKAALVLNGDSFCPLDLTALYDLHAMNGGAVSLAVVDPGQRRDGGFIDVSPDGRVRSFEEREYRRGRMMNAGVYLFEPAALAAMPPGASSLEKDVLPALVDRGVYAWATSTPLHDIGTPERWRRFQNAYLRESIT